jgi:hypothetical protein
MAVYTEPIGDTYQYDKDYNRMCDFLGLDLYERRDIKVAKKVSHLTDWALKQSEGKDLTDAMVTIAELRKSNSLHTAGNTNQLDSLFQEVRLKEDFQTLQDTREVEKKIEEKKREKREKKLEEKKEVEIKTKPSKNAAHLAEELKEKLIQEMNKGETQE